VAIEPIFRDAIIFASLLSLLSVGLTLTYLITKVPNFAQGSIATIGVYVTLTATQILKSEPYEYLPVSFVLGGLANLVLYFIGIRPLIRRGATLVSMMVATIAYDLVLFASLNMYADYLTKTFKIASRDFILRQYDATVFGQPGIFLAAPVLAAGLAAGLYLFLTKTRFGIAMRAAIEDQALAGVLGINVRRVYIVSWFLAGALGGMAGSLLGIWFQANPGFGGRVLISIFAASVVGGLQNIYGAIVGGVVVGLAEILGTNWLGSLLGTWVLPYRPIIPLLAMVIALLLAPQGITGLKWRNIRRKMSRR